MAVDFIRRLKGAAKNAVVWGAAWFGLAVVTYGVLRVARIIPATEFWALDAIFVATRVAVMGAIAGGFVSVLISLLYRGRRLSEISWLRFGLGGGVAAGLFVPAFMITASVLTGGGVPPLGAIDSDALMAALFGGISAGGSMWLAQRGQAASLAAPDGHERLAVGAGPFRAQHSAQRESAPAGSEE